MEITEIKMEIITEIMEITEINSTETETYGKKLGDRSRTTTEITEKNEITEIITEITEKATEIVTEKNNGNNNGKNGKNGKNLQRDRNTQQKIR